MDPISAKLFQVQGIILFFGAQANIQLLYGICFLGFPPGFQ